MSGILVTGSTGFIGNYVVRELLRRNIEVIATSRDRKKAEKFDWYPAVTYIECDLSENTGSIAKNYAGFFHNPGKVIHLAWPGLPNYRELFHFEKNLVTDYSFLKNLVLDGISDITVTGTCFEYGLMEGCLSEDMPSDPQNSYGIAKDTLRKFLQQLERHRAFNMKWIRLFYMYGKGQHPGSLLAQLDKALEHNEPIFNMSGGEQQRDYLPVETVASNIVEIALQNKVTGIINCCSGRPVAVKDLVKEYLLKKDKSINLNFGHYPYSSLEPMRFWGDDSKLKMVTNKNS